MGIRVAEVIHIIVSQVFKQIGRKNAGYVGYKDSFLAVTVSYALNILTYRGNRCSKTICLED